MSSELECPSFFTIYLNYLGPRVLVTSLPLQAQLPEMVKSLEIFLLNTSKIWFVPLGIKPTEEGMSLAVIIHVFNAQCEWYGVEGYMSPFQRLKQSGGYVQLVWSKINIQLLII